MTASDRPRNGSAARNLKVAGELLLLTLLVLSPWPFGCTHPRHEFWLGLGVGALVSLWAAHAIVTRRFSYSSDAISICLLGLVLVTAFQLVPLPQKVVDVLSPTTGQWHRGLLPHTPELLPGEDAADVPSRGTRLPMTVAPASVKFSMLSANSCASTVQTLVKDLG